MTAAEHHCERMDHAVEAADLPIRYYSKFREWGVEYGGGDAFFELLYCPWDGEKLPESLRDEWFCRLEKLGLEPEDPRVPEEMRSDAWWREAGL